MKKKKWFAINNAASLQRPEIRIYDDIGMGGIYADEFANALEELGDVAELDVRFSSRGGSVVEGVAIYTALARHPAKKFGHIDSVAASIASLIAMACDTLSMSEPSMLMIHKASGGMGGTADEHRAAGAVLDMIDKILVAEYVRKTGLAEDVVMQMLADETYMDAAQAKALGFADVITAPDGTPTNSISTRDEVTAYLVAISKKNIKSVMQADNAMLSMLNSMTAHSSDNSGCRDYGKGEVMNKEQLIAKLKEAGVDVTALQTDAGLLAKALADLSTAKQSLDAHAVLIGEHSHDEVKDALVAADAHRATVVTSIVNAMRSLKQVEDSPEAIAAATAVYAGMPLAHLEAMEKPLTAAVVGRNDFDADAHDPEKTEKKSFRKTTTQKKEG